MKNRSYQVFSGDIVIVNPNTTRIKNAGILETQDFNNPTFVYIIFFNRNF